MASQPTHLVSGLIASTQAAIFTAPANAILSNFSLVLTNLTENVVEVTFFRNDGTERLLAKRKVPAGAGKTIAILEIAGAVLQSTHKIEAVADTASAVNFQLDAVQSSV